jgi:hypothetical protein
MDFPSGTNSEILNPPPPSCVQEWTKSAKPCRPGDMQVGGSRASVEAGWVLVNKKDLPHDHAAAASRDIAPVVSEGYSHEDIINPLRQHIDTMKRSS